MEKILIGKLNDRNKKNEEKRFIYSLKKLKAVGPILMNGGKIQTRR